MATSELVVRSPLRILDQRPEGGLGPGQIGLVAARAGTGKTAFLVQVGLDVLLRDERLLHVGIGDTVAHIRTRYLEIFRSLATRLDHAKAAALEADVERRRMIVAFRFQPFTRARLEERLRDLAGPAGFVPQAAVVDHLEMGNTLRPMLAELAGLAAARELALWIACRVPLDAGPLPGLLAPVLDLCRVAVGLEGDADRVGVTILRNPTGTEGPSDIRLDPRTLLLGAASAPR